MQQAPKDLEFLHQAMAQVSGTLDKKQDVWTNSAPVFENFDMMLELDIAPLNFAIAMCRLKMNRLKSRLRSHSLSSNLNDTWNDKDLEDSLIDLASYAIIALGIMKRAHGHAIEEEAEWREDACASHPTPPVNPFVPHDNDSMRRQLDHARNNAEEQWKKFRETSCGEYEPPEDMVKQVLQDRAQRDREIVKKELDNYLQTDAGKAEIEKLARQITDEGPVQMNTADPPLQGRKLLLRVYPQDQRNPHDSIIVHQDHVNDAFLPIPNTPMKATVLYEPFELSTPHDALGQQGRLTISMEHEQNLDATKREQAAQQSDADPIERYNHTAKMCHEGDHKKCLEQIDAWIADKNW